MTESQIQAKILFALGRRPDVRIFRNNVGAFKTANGNFQKFGLCVGSADLIGWVTVNGRAIFLSVEVKTETGTPSDEQETWLKNVKRMGGIAFIARSPEQALQKLEEEIADETYRIS